jgi:hypothetical protein
MRAWKMHGVIGTWHAAGGETQKKLRPSSLLWPTCNIFDSFMARIRDPWSTPGD